MKKLFAVLTAFVMIFSLAACGGSEETTTTNETPAASEEKPLSIVCTTFPIYDWVRNIVGDDDGVKLTLLLDNGVDLHNYQATADDIVTIHDCDVFVFVGGASDKWVNDVVSEAANEDLISVDLIKTLGDSAKFEEAVEGMEEEEEEEEELDEHIWLSLKNAEKLVSAIQSALSEADPDNSSKYEANTKAYIEKLKELDEKYTETVKNAKYDTVLFGDRFPFRYLVDDYGLKYYAAFAGCSAESEASFETVSFLAKKVSELDLPAVLTIENSDGKIAQTIVETSKTDAKILSVNSMQSVVSVDETSYLEIMEGNLDVFTQALN